MLNAQHYHRSAFLWSLFPQLTSQSQHSSPVWTSSLFQNWKQRQHYNYYKKKKKKGYLIQSQVIMTRNPLQLTVLWHLQISSHSSWDILQSCNSLSQTFVQAISDHSSLLQWPCPASLSPTCSWSQIPEDRMMRVRGVLQIIKERRLKPDINWQWKKEGTCSTNYVFVIIELTDSLLWSALRRP